MFFAKHEEGLDTVKNEKNLDKILFSGVYIEKLEGTTLDKIPVMKEGVYKVLDAFMDFTENEDGSKDYPEIIFISHLNPQVKSGWRVIEARFESKEAAGTIREEFGRKRKEMRRTGIVPDSLKGIGINLSVTKETKIRIEVLRALAKIVNAHTTEECNAFVLQFVPRPMLKIIIKKSEQVSYSRVFGYTEAIAHVQELYPINDQDLIEAYNKAGNMRNLEHKFVLLKESNFVREDVSENEESRRSKRPKK